MRFRCFAGDFALRFPNQVEHKSIGINGEYKICEQSVCQLDLVPGMQTNYRPEIGDVNISNTGRYGS